MAISVVGSGKPVLLLHSSMSSHRQWQQLVAQLHHDHLCIMPDLQGYGFPASKVLGNFETRDYQMADEAAVVVAAIRELGIDQAITIVGHSFGGALALHLAMTKPFAIKELDLFEKAGCLLVNDNHFPVNVFSITEDYETFLKEISIKYPDFQTLQALGLIHSNSGTREIANPEKKDLDINYFDRTLKFSPEADVEGVVKIQIPSFYSLTPVGEQILQHLKPSPNETYYEWLKKNYKVRNYNLKDE